ADFGPSGRVLPNREAKEVKAHLILSGMQGVSDPRLALLQLQSSCGQERLDDVPCVLDALAGRMQNHTVVGIPNHLWAIVVPKRLVDASLQSIEGNVREQGGG